MGNPQSLQSHLLRIGSDGTILDLGLLDDSTNFIAGDVDDSDALWVRNGRNLSRIDIAKSL